MCEPTTLAIIGIGLAVAGTGISYSAGQSAISASKNAQEQAAISQNTAFMSRMAAQQEQLTQEQAVNTASAQRFQANQSETQQAQVDALNQREAATKSINSQEAAISDQASKSVTEATAATTGAKLADAQTGQMATQQAMNAPTQDNIQASNPLGALNTGVTKDATDKAKAGAEKYTQQYGDNLARLSSYNAPIALAGNTATTLGTNLMPAAVADQLVKTGAPAILAPSSLAYQQAGDYGASRQQADALLTQSGLSLADIAAQNKINLADLGQSDDAARIQGNLNVAQAEAAAKAGLGQGITAIGNAGISYAGSQGAFAGGAKAAATTPTGTVVFGKAGDSLTYGIK